MIRKRSPRNAALVREEIALGKRLFISRGQRSEISGAFLGDEYNHAFASHILTKAASPKFRLYHKNIVLMTPEEHRLWEFSRHTLRSKPEWDWVFRLFELLRQEYNTKDRWSDSL